MLPMFPVHSFYLVLMASLVHERILQSKGILSLILFQLKDICLYVPFVTTSHICIANALVNRITAA